MNASFNFTPYPENPFREGSQNHRLYERLKVAPVTNAEIVREMNIFNSTGRAADLRKFLKSHGLDVISKPLGDGLYQYQLS